MNQEGVSKQKKDTPIWRRCLARVFNAVSLIIGLSTMAPVASDSQTVQLQKRHVHTSHSVEVNAIFWLERGCDLWWVCAVNTHLGKYRTDFYRHSRFDALSCSIAGMFYSNFIKWHSYNDFRNALSHQFSHLFLNDLYMMPRRRVNYSCVRIALTYPRWRNHLCAQLGTI